MRKDITILAPIKVCADGLHCGPCEYLWAPECTLFPRPCRLRYTADGAYKRCLACLRGEERMKEKTRGKK
jgi:hypothetical protein